MKNFEIRLYTSTKVGIVMEMANDVQTARENFVYQRLPGALFLETICAQTDEPLFIQPSQIEAFTIRELGDQTNE